MAWILQGNPKRFDIDDYLTRYPYVYWSTPTNQKDFSLGDKVFMWRAGPQAGAVARGIVRELPVRKDSVKHRGNLGDDLWVANQDAPSVIKVGIELKEVRLTPEEGMLERGVLKGHRVIGRNRIITNPEGSVFRISDEECAILEDMWGVIHSDLPLSSIYSDVEGSILLQAHYRRERSRKLVAQKKDDILKIYGEIFCEVCGLRSGDRYPKEFGVDFIEVHHIVPLSKAKKLVRTTLKDLLLVCANCHHLIHRSADYEINLKKLQEHFS